jgi:hypothetical protein
MKFQEAHAAILLLKRLGLTPTELVAPAEVRAKLDLELGTVVDTIDGVPIELARSVPEKAREPLTIDDNDPEPFRFRVSTINHIRERLAANKSKKDKQVFLSDKAWALVLQSLENLTP